MREDRLVAGLDIGSAKTTALIAEVVGDFPKHPSIKILGVGQTRTTGNLCTPGVSVTRGVGLPMRALRAASTCPFGSASRLGISVCIASGEIAPRSDGPSRMPATTSPMTGGCPK